MSTTAPLPVAIGTDRSLRAQPSTVRVDRLTKAFPVHRSWREVVAHPLQRAERTTVVDSVSFEVGASEFFGLLGVNGAGKSTLFRMLGTQLLPDSGTAVIGGYDIVREPRAVRGLLTPVVADERSLNWRLSARENLELFAELYRLPRRRVVTRINEVLEAVELKSTGARMVGTFSSGMKQRLLIARALLPQPQVLLLDEPTRSLDPLSARRFRQFLRQEIADRQGCTVLLATHSAEEAFELCDRIAVLDRGRLLAVGRVQELMGEVQDHRYRLTVRGTQLESVRRTLEAAGIQVFRPEAEQGEESSWCIIEVAIDGGAEGVAAAVSRLASSGFHLSGVEHRPITLADLLERVVARKKEH